MVGASALDQVWHSRSSSAPVCGSGKNVRRTFTVDFFGWRYTGDLGRFVDWTIYFYGAYELGILKLLAVAAQQAGEGAVFLDVGANVGQHSLFMSRHAAQIHAFEPWLAVRDRLLSLLAGNGVNNVHVHDFALGDSDQVLPFYAPAGANLGTGSFYPDVNHNQSAGSLRVRSGDAVIEELGLARVDVVKIDTEGFEAHVLSGLRRTLALHGPIVVVEIALSVQDNIDVPSLFPADWQIMIIDSHPEICQLQPFALNGQSMVSVVAGPPDKVSRLAGFV